MHWRSWNCLLSLESPKKNTVNNKPASAPYVLPSTSDTSASTIILCLMSFKIDIKWLSLACDACLSDDSLRSLFKTLFLSVLKRAVESLVLLNISDTLLKVWFSVSEVSIKEPSSRSGVRRPVFWNVKKSNSLMILSSSARGDTADSWELWNFLFSSLSNCINGTKANNNNLKG